MRGGFVPSLVAVIISHDLSVHHQPFVRIDTNAEKARISVNLQYLVASPEIVKDASSERGCAIKRRIVVLDRFFFDLL